MQSLFADILSVLAMTYSDTEPRGTLRYRLLSTSMSKNATEPGSWGHEYIRHLAAELGTEYTIRQEEKQEIEELHKLGIECAKFLLLHNAEPDAVDLLEELEIVDRLISLCDDKNYARVCAYMIRYVSYASLFSITEITLVALPSSLLRTMYPSYVLCMNSTWRMVNSQRHLQLLFVWAIRTLFYKTLETLEIRK